MSFGFKKKIYTTSKKNGNSIKEKEKLSLASINTDNDGGDDNGNRGNKKKIELNWMKVIN